MENNYTLSYVFEIIIKSEIRFKKQILKFGKESWPITRNLIWLTLIHFEEKNLQKQKNNNLSLILRKLDKRLLKRKLINFYQNFIYAVSKKDFLKDSKVIFFSRGIYLEKLSSGILFDRIIDPIYMQSVYKNKSLKIYIDNPIVKNNFFLKGMNYFPNKFYNNNFNVSEYKSLKESGIMLLKLFIEFNSLNEIEELLINELKKSIKYYLVSKKKSKQFLKKFSSIKKIFLTSWYVPDSMGIIASAKELGIKTVEIQHGQQGKFHSGNSGWNFFPDNGYINMPDNFWCWDERSIRNILKQSPNRKFHKPIFGGNGWPDWYKTYSKINYNQVPLKTPKIRLLFTMQSKLGATNDNPLPEGLLDLIKYYENLYLKYKEKEFELRIRLHPNCIEQNMNYLKIRLDKLFYSNLVSLSSKRRCCFYDDLIWSNHHLTLYSSCALEALMFGIKSAVYGDEGYKIYEEEIKNKSITFVKYNSSEEILNWINRDQSSSKVYEKDS